MGADERAMLEVGQIMKAHGLKGQVSVDLWTDRTERVEPGTILYTDRGPLNVVGAIAHQNRYLVTFAEIADRSAAERWRGVVLSAPPIDDPEALWINDLFEATVSTVDGVIRGRVVSVEQNPVSDLLVLDNGALVPLTFVISVVANEQIVVDVPEGLFE